MKNSFNALFSVLAVAGMFAAVVWLSNGAPLVGPAGVYANTAVETVQSVGMSSQQMITAGLIVFILIWAMGSLRPGKGGK